MNREETGKILFIISGMFPRQYSNMSPQQIDAITSTWADMLEDYEFSTVQQAVKALFATSKWPPSIAEVIEKCQYILNGGQEPLNEQAAWSLVNKAITNSSYHAKEEFEKLPKVIQNVIHDPGQLREWARSEKSSIETVVASNFMRSYKTELVREKEQQALPESVKTLISSIDVKMIE